MATVTASQQELRDALYAAQRALLHASYLNGAGPVMALITTTLANVSRVLDIGRDEANEQGCS